MDTIIFLIVISLGGREANNIVIHEMPNLKVCESVGKSTAAMSKYIKWTCIEGPR